MGVRNVLIRKLNAQLVQQDHIYMLHILYAFLIAQKFKILHNLQVFSFKDYTEMIKKINVKLVMKPVKFVLGNIQ